MNELRVRNGVSVYGGILRVITGCRHLFKIGGLGLGLTVPARNLIELCDDMLLLANRYAALRRRQFFIYGYEKNRKGCRSNRGSRADLGSRACKGSVTKSRRGVCRDKPTHQAFG
jgi:hypothetical protein